MPKAVIKHKYERFETLFKRFNRAVDKDKTLLEVKKRQEFIKNSEKNKIRKNKARKAEKKRMRDSMLPDSFE